MLKCFKISIIEFSGHSMNYRIHETFYPIFLENNWVIFVYMIILTMWLFVVYLDAVKQSDYDKWVLATPLQQ